MDKIIEEYRGIRDLVAAILLTDTAEELTYDAPFPIAGIAELTKTTENSSEAHFYDNIAAIVIDSVGSDTVTCQCSAIPLPVLAKLTGQDYDEATGTLIEGEAKCPYVGIGYVTEDTSGNEVFVWRHKVKCSIPASTHSTKNNSTDANGQEITFTGINTTHKFTKTGKTDKGINHIKNGLITEADFFANVQTIDTLSQITPPTPVLTGITVTPATATVNVGGSVTLTATLVPAGVTADVTWASTDEDVAIVVDGKVAGVSEGSATIIAMAGGYASSCAVTVEQA